MLARDTHGAETMQDRLIKATYGRKFWKDLKHHEAQFLNHEYSSETYMKRIVVAAQPKLMNQDLIHCKNWVN